jgi:hypothetical protein
LPGRHEGALWNCWWWAAVLAGKYRHYAAMMLSDAIRVLLRGVGSKHAGRCELFGRAWCKAARVCSKRIMSSSDAGEERGGGT